MTLLEATRAVHGFGCAGLEGDAGNTAATRADSLEHLSRCADRPAVIPPAGVAAAIALGTPGRAAIRAAGGFRKAATRVEVLLTSGEREGLAAIATRECLVARHLVDGSLIFQRIDRAGWPRNTITNSVGSVDTRQVRTRNAPARPV